MLKEEGGGGGGRGGRRGAGEGEGEGEEEEKKERRNKSFRVAGSCQNLLNGMICKRMFFLSLQEAVVLLPADSFPI